jgi:hypothetical protein
MRGSCACLYNTKHPIYNPSKGFTVYLKNTNYNCSLDSRFNTQIRLLITVFTYYFLTWMSPWLIWHCLTLKGKCVSIYRLALPNKEIVWTGKRWPVVVMETGSWSLWIINERACVPIYTVIRPPRDGQILWNQHRTFNSLTAGRLITYSGYDGCERRSSVSRRAGGLTFQRKTLDDVI